MTAITVSDLKITGIREAEFAAGITQGKNAVPLRIWHLIAGHSHIRCVQVSWTWENLPYYSSVHIVRHKIGIEHFVKSQRKGNRSELPQDALVDHSVVTNLQGLLTLCKARLCKTCDKTTILAVHALRFRVLAQLPMLEHLLVPKCVYHGYCPEFHMKQRCRYLETEGTIPRDYHTAYREAYFPTRVVIQDDYPLRLAR